MSPLVRTHVSVGRATGDRTWLQVARDAEALGFAGLRIADHWVSGLHAPFAALAAAAAVTERLEVGTYVLNNDLRHPIDVAREAATIAEISDGRFVLGLGAGHMRSEYDEAGLVFDPAPMRVARMAESAEVISRLLAGGRVEHQGSTLHIAHEVRPTGQPGVPLLIGGNGRRVLQTAARIADIVAFTGFSPTGDGSTSDLRHFGDIGFAERLVLVRDAAGDRFSELRLDVLVQFVEITDRPDVELDRLAGRTQLPVEVLRTSPFVLVGSVAAIVDKIGSMRDRFGITDMTVFAGRSDTSPALESFGELLDALRV